LTEPSTATYTTLTAAELSRYTVEDFTKSTTPPYEFWETAVGTVVDHPFIARCKATCGVEVFGDIP